MKWKACLKMFDLSPYEYAEVRIENGETFRACVKEEINSSAGCFYGISVRVLRNGAWGFVATNNAEANVNELLKKADRIAGLTKGNVKIIRSKKESSKSSSKTEWFDVDEVILRLMDAKKETKGEMTISSNLTFSASLINREFYNSEGKELVERATRFYFNSTVTVRKGGITQVGTESLGSRFGITRLKIEEAARGAKERAELLLGAKSAPKGRFAAVLDPEITGTFIHEVVGHATEADAVISRESALSDKYEKKIGNELVNIVDDPSLPYFGGYEYDDEGVRGRRIELVKEGVLSGFLNSRETAAELGHTPNGHARAEGYALQPIVRMSNTLLLPGGHSKSDVFDLRKGIYVKGSAGGSVDIFSGGFMFKAKEGYEIKNGEVREPLRDVVITGNIIDVLNNITAVGQDFSTHAGFCGKSGQLVPVEDGGPHIAVSSITIG